MKTIVHIGSHKTGSTSIQHFLAKNAAALASAGIHLPTFGEGARRKSDNLPLARWLRDDGPQPDLSALRPPEGQDARAAIISSENFYMCHAPSDFERARSVLPADARILCYLREPSDHILSLYKQGVKSPTKAEHRDLKTFLDQRTADMLAGGRFIYHRYDENVAAWRAAFPDVVVGVYRNLANTELAHRFFEDCGFPLPSSVRFVYPTQRKPSPSAASAFLMLCLTRLQRRGEIGDDEAAALRRTIRDNDDAFRPGMTEMVAFEDISLKPFVEAFMRMNPEAAPLLRVPESSKASVPFPVQLLRPDTKVLAFARETARALAD